MQEPLGDLMRSLDEMRNVQDGGSVASVCPPGWAWARSGAFWFLVRNDGGRWGDACGQVKTIVVGATLYCFLKNDFATRERSGFVQRVCCRRGNIAADAGTLWLVLHALSPPQKHRVPRGTCAGDAAQVFRIAKTTTTESGRAGVGPGTHRDRVGTTPVFAIPAFSCLFGN